MRSTHWCECCVLLPLCMYYECCEKCRKCRNTNKKKVVPSSPRDNLRSYPTRVQMVEQAKETMKDQLC